MTTALAWLIVTTEMTARAIRRQRPDDPDDPAVRALLDRVAALEARLGESPALGSGAGS